MSASRSAVAATTRLRLGIVGARALASRRHPILAHLVPTRRCNLTCGYCNEYDDRSPPVPTSEMLERIRHLAKLQTSMVCFSGGEPLLHPELDLLIATARELGMFTELITNGYLLTAKRIHALNRSGLQRLQISVDNVQPDQVSMKSLKVLDQKLVNLARHARFDVNINSVLGGGTKPADALSVTSRARELGFSTTVGIIHDGDGQLGRLNDEEISVYRALGASMPMGFSLFTRFKDNLVEGRPNEWRCRAGARYLYICEDGLVHYCSQQRGFPGIPLVQYTTQDIEREFEVEKHCAPYCTVSCVHAIAPFDHWRGPQRQRAEPRVAPAELVQLRRERKATAPCHAPSD